MTNNVKQFIEQTIDIIDKQDWIQLFDIWYTKYSVADHKLDDSHIFELFYVLQQIGYDYAQHEKARQQLIEKYFNEYIDDKIFECEKTINAIDTIMQLRSWLGFNVYRLKPLFVETCKNRGLEPSDTTKGKFILP